jgi:hypothetical protein
LDITKINQIKRNKNYMDISYHNYQKFKIKSLFQKKLIKENKQNLMNAELKI